MYWNRKTKIIVVMLIAVVFMAVGYAILSTNLNIQGTSNLTDSWGIRISNVESTSTGRAYNISEPTYSNTTMTFNVGVKEPGDKMTFTVTVQNYGTLDAILDNIDISNSGSRVIKYGIEGIQSGTRLLAGESKTFTITTEFDINATEIPNEPVKELTITLNYIQDDGQSITPSDPVISAPTLVNAILEDNEEKNDSNIDFSKTSEQDGTKGLYYTSTNTQGNQPTYYFRGAVENNYVSFAGYYWRVIRINEDSSVRMIYQGTTATATGASATIGTSAFNEEYSDNTYLGYMYSFPQSSDYDSTHANAFDSTIKIMLDDWYRKSLFTYASYLEDAGFCGDRSLAAGPGYGAEYSDYETHSRIMYLSEPQFSCPQSNDLYTYHSSYSNGNGMLSYPIGLISADEAMYAGGTTSNNNSSPDNTSYYLSIGISYWTMSPFIFSSSAYVGNIIADGALGASEVNNAMLGVRPVINLKSSVEISGGDGTSSNPYVVITN